MSKILFTKGNKKLPKTTFILNVSSAMECPARFNGKCQCPDKCYALKAERQYSAVKPFRDNQRVQFTEKTAEEIALGMLFTKTGKRTKIETFTDDTFKRPDRSKSVCAV
jgi:hypothetical protein